jgi:hypothetical protein
MELEVNNVYLTNIYFTGYVKSIYQASFQPNSQDFSVFDEINYELST